MATVALLPPLYARLRLPVFAVLAYAMIGIGVGAAGTSLLALLATAASYFIHSLGVS